MNTAILAGGDVIVAILSLLVGFWLGWQARRFISWVKNR